MADLELGAELSESCAWASKMVSNSDVLVNFHTTSANSVMAPLESVYPWKSCTICFEAL